MGLSHLDKLPLMLLFCFTVQSITCQNVIIDINLPGVMILPDTTSQEGITTSDVATITEDSTTRDPFTDVTVSQNTVSQEFSSQGTDSTITKLSQEPGLSSSEMRTVSQKTNSRTEVTINTETPMDSTSADEITRDLTSSTLTRAPAVVVIPRILPVDGALCEKNQHRGCNISNLERCVLIRERSTRCVCLTGYARDVNSKTCIAVEQYMVTLKTQVTFTNDLNDVTSEIYRQLEFDAQDTLIKSLQSSNLWAITKDISILGFRRGDDGMVLVDYKVDVSREYAPSEEMVREELIKGVVASLRKGENRVELSEMLAAMSSVTAPDPCSDLLLNHCDVTATCQRSRRGFVCSCQPGDTDLSYNRLEAPGEICSPTSCSCDNGGVCEKTVGGVGCRCPDWYLGSRCEFDGKAALIAILCFLGLSAAVGTFIFTYCWAVGRYKRKKRQSYKRRSLIVEKVQPRRQYLQYYLSYPHTGLSQYTYNPHVWSYWSKPTNALFSPRHPPESSNTKAISWKWSEA